MRTVLQSLIMPLILLAAIIIIFLFGDFIPLNVARLLYSLSLTIKEVIVILMPIIIVIFVINSLSSLPKNAVSYTIFLISFIFVSNYLAVIYGYGFFALFNWNFEHAIQVSNFDNPSLEPLWKLPKIKLITNELALFVGFSIGIYLSISKNMNLKNLVNIAQIKCHVLLKKAVIPLIPIFVTGFVIKLKYDHEIDSSITTYGKILMLFTLSQASYLLLILIIASGFNFKRMVRYFKNVLPATITGFTTVSSAATLPITIHSTEKNITERWIAHSFIPVTVNIHLIGTAVGTSVIILTSFIIFNLDLPSIMTYLIFTFYFTLGKFAVVGIPGGSIFILAPIIEQYLNTTPEMIAFITALVLLFDPIDTSFNVTSNSLLAIIFEKIYKKFQKIFSFKITKFRDLESN